MVISELGGLGEITGQQCLEMVMGPIDTVLTGPQFLLNLKSPHGFAKQLSNQLIIVTNSLAVSPGFLSVLPISAESILTVVNTTHSFVFIKVLRVND